MSGMAATANLIYSPAAVRELDRTAINSFGIPGYTLMERAAQASFAAIRSRFADTRHWLILCGAGNNAGDGYVLARLARAAGIEVTVAALGDPHRLRGDAQRSWTDFRARGGVVVQLSEAVIADADLAVDALLGTGLDRPLDGIWAHAVELLNEFGSTRPLIALDIPSGLDAHSGQVLGVAVRACLTITFVGLKRGLFAGAGPAHVGELIFDDLAVPTQAIHAVTPCARLLDEEMLRALLAPRPVTAHKGLYGHVLVIGGNHGMGGAARLAGEAALRSGAGLVSVATRPAHVAGLLSARPELMGHGVEDAASLQPLLERATVLALGPGLGQDDWARALYGAALDSGKPLVVDADALNLLAGSRQQRDNWVLTPHPGEAGRLLGKTSAGIQQDRFASLAALCEHYGGTVILKGRCTLVGREGNLPLVINKGNPGMASAGMGDVLTGIAAGLLAQFPAADPQLLGGAAAFAHAAAGDRAAATGERGLLAGDLLDQLRPCLNPAR